MDDRNVEFRQGDIESRPVEDRSMDVVISNCVINLAPDKRRVFQEIHRVLEPGGRFSISDMVSYGKIPYSIRQDMSLWAGCVAGAMDQEAYLRLIEESGFEQVRVRELMKYDCLKGRDYGIASITVEGKNGG